MKLKSFQICVVMLVVVFSGKLCFAQKILFFDKSYFQLDLETEKNDEKPLRNSTSDTTTDQYGSSNSNDPNYVYSPDFSVFKAGFEMSYSTNDFVVLGVNFELGVPNIFEGMSFSMGLGEGFIASEASQELGFFFCISLMAKYTFNIEDFYYPGVGLKYLAGGSINFVGESDKYETLGITGFVRLPFLEILLLETSATLELITDSKHSVGVCFDLLFGLHF